MINGPPDFGTSHVDTGASNHIVSSSDAISDAHPNTITNTLMVGNGKRLFIHSIGSSIISTLTTPLQPKTVLQVPTITPKNIP